MSHKSLVYGYLEYHQVFVFFLFFFNDTATTEIYTLSLHDALPIYEQLEAYRRRNVMGVSLIPADVVADLAVLLARDRKSTRLNSSHSQISYAVFCLKKKNRTRLTPR